jgi:CBS domain-containing protein
MFGDQERVTVRELMTEDPDHVKAGATADAVHEWLADHGYSAAPIAREEPPYLYVTREGLEAALPAATDEPVYEHADRVALDDLIAPDLGFKRLLAELEERAFYFVGWHGDVVGIVTRADLNRPAAHAFLYTRVGELEMRLRDLVDAETDWEGTLAMLQAEGPGEETEYDAVVDAYREYADADLQLREIDYTTFWQLQTVVESEGAAVDLLPFEDAEATGDALRRIRELRNQVAHYGNVVHAVDADLLDSGRNVHQLAETYGDIVDCLEALRSWADTEAGERPIGPNTE